MKPQYNVQELIDNIKRRCLVPTSQLTYQPSGFTALANDTLQGEVVPLLMSTREEYFVDYIDVSSPADGVISFPDNTVASKVRTVAYVQQSSPLVLINLPRIDLDVVAGVGFNGFNTVAGFYVQGNDIVLYPSRSVPTNTQIRIYYYKRTLVLTPPEKYGQITVIDEMNSQVQVDSIPSSWEVGTVLNAVDSNTPFQVTNEETTITDINSPLITLDTVVDLSVGDYLSEEGTSAIPQIPIEAHAYLAQLTAAKVLEGLDDGEGMANALKAAEKLKENLLIMLSQRVDGSIKKVMNPSGGLRLSAGLGLWGRAGRGWY